MRILELPTLNFLKIDRSVQKISNFENAKRSKAKHPRADSSYLSKRLKNRKFWAMDLVYGKPDFLSDRQKRLSHRSVLWDEEGNNDSQKSNCSNTKHDDLKSKIVAYEAKNGSH